MLLNLLTNAIKYAPESPAIHLRARPAGNQAEIEIQDFGPGIPASELPNIFSRFYQVSRPSRSAAGGLGLGLYIAREMAEAHGGTLEAESEPGQGTTFMLGLPLRG